MSGNKQNGFAVHMLNQCVKAYPNQCPKENVTKENISHIIWCFSSLFAMHSEIVINKIKKDLGKV